MVRKFISKRFINDISRVIVCNICFGYLKDPVECAKCQNVWCQNCIANNQHKCPCKCENTTFIKPHRFFRQFIAEIVIECERCSERMSFSAYQQHLSSNTCEKEKQPSSITVNELYQQKPELLSPPPRKAQKIVQTPEHQTETIEFQSIQSNALRYHYQPFQNNTKGMLIRNKKSTEEQKFQENQNDLIEDDNDEDIVFPISNKKNQQYLLKQSSNQQQFNVKIEHGFVSEGFSSILSQQESKIQSEFPGYKRLQIQTYDEESGWSAIEEPLNREVNLSFLKLLENEEHIDSQRIQIRNKVFDFSRFEQYDAYSSLAIDSGDFTKQIVSKRKRFLPFSNLEDLERFVKIYVCVESDRIYYDRTDTKQILRKFFCNVQGAFAKIRTHRSTIDLNDMREFNGTKLRDIKFSLSFEKNSNSGSDIDSEQEDNTGENDSKSI